jgi:hypothetical protein
MRVAKRGARDKATMRYRVRLTRGAEADLKRLLDFALDRKFARVGGDPELAEQAFVAIRAVVATCKASPCTC